MRGGAGALFYSPPHQHHIIDKFWVFFISPFLHFEKDIILKLLPATLSTISINLSIYLFRKHLPLSCT
ncbi:hypothetical protein MIMGU_mgv1a017552mg [Erythranthe guttata]|uniref:Uncharacterized protein n=1 Tax=Erythranthe guttata TaxID=4155 RepID=A0A022QTD1_ERYGU|nr:hypothetical protein MIMGU_mgv1a017552mg [Erythranthe guttata]